MVVRKLFPAFLILIFAAIGKSTNKKSRGNFKKVEGEERSGFRQDFLEKE